MTDVSRPYHLAVDEGEALWFFGNVVTIKAGTPQTGGAFTLAEFINPPGFAPPLHRHRAEDEAFYILEGRAEFRCGDDVINSGPGSFVYLPRGLPHTFLVSPDEPLHSLQITTPAQFERYARAVGERAPSRTLPPPPDAPPDLARLSQIGEEFGVELLEPPPQH